jgi:hypothetical protein
MTFLPCIVEKTDQFLDRLNQFAASGEEFPMGELCTSLTFDIIGITSIPNVL